MSETFYAYLSMTYIYALQTLLNIDITQVKKHDNYSMCGLENSANFNVKK